MRIGSSLIATDRSEIAAVALGGESLSKPLPMSATSSSALSHGIGKVLAK